MPFESDKETKKIIQFLQGERINSKLIPFIGSGFSSNIDGFPIWRDFINLLSEKLRKRKGVKFDLTKVFDHRYMEAAEFFYWKMGYAPDRKNEEIVDKGKYEFCKLLIAEFDRNDKSNVDEPAWLQHILLINKFNKIYTTNWDFCLENTALQKGNGYKLYVCESDAKKFDEAPIESLNGTTDINMVNHIIKFHGCYQSSYKTIVASESDYYDRLNVLDKNPLDTAYKEDLKNNHFIFIGYSLSDVNVTYFLSQVNILRTSLPYDKQQKIYFVVPKSRESIEKDKVVFYEKHKNTHFIPLLNNAEQAEIEKEDLAIKEAAKIGNEMIPEKANEIYKNKIIKFLELI